MWEGVSARGCVVWITDMYVSVCVHVVWVGVYSLDIHTYRYIHTTYIQRYIHAYIHIYIHAYTYHTYTYIHP